MRDDGERLQVSLVAIPEAMVSTLAGIYDVLSSLGAVSSFDPAVSEISPFDVTIVGETFGPMDLASGLPLPTQKAISQVEETDIVIVPSLLIPNGDWQKGQHPDLVEWIAKMHSRGATLCSACSGIFLIAETGLFDDQDSTVHWSYEGGFKKLYPEVRLHPERALVAAGEREQLVSSGASTSWHDLVLYLIAKHAGPATAHGATKFFALQWHQEGLAPYIVFSAPTDHDDAVVRAAQAWLTTHYSVAKPVEEMVRRSGLPERSFKRRFTKATGHSPISYVQRLRTEEGKRRLERTSAPVEEIAWQVGYEDPAFFRRLFKRTTGLSPSTYRRKFQIPEYAGPTAQVR